jgi:hypothetical protein
VDSTSPAVDSRSPSRYGESAPRGPSTRQKISLGIGLGTWTMMSPDRASFLTLPRTERNATGAGAPMTCHGISSPRLRGQ